MYIYVENKKFFISKFGTITKNMYLIFVDSKMLKITEFPFNLISMIEECTKVLKVHKPEVHEIFLRHNCYL